MNSIFHYYVDKSMNDQCCKFCLGFGTNLIVDVAKKMKFNTDENEERNYKKCIICDGTGINIKFKNKKHHEIFLRILKIIQNNNDDDSTKKTQHEKAEINARISSILEMVPQARIFNINEKMILFTLENHGVIIEDGDIVSIF